MYPFAEQILAYRAADKEKKIGGLVLEVKGDFCHKVREILGPCTRSRGMPQFTATNPAVNSEDA
jgi:hypothetical protein